MISRPALALALICCAAPTVALADEGKVSIRYAMTVAGLPIGTAALNANVGADGAYKVVASAKVGGVLTLVNDGKGSATANGKLSGNVLSSSGFALNSVSAKKQQTIRMALSHGTVTDTEMKPPASDRSDRIALTDANRKGVIDPLTAMLAVMPHASGTPDASVCQRTLPVFDGGQRFDVRLSYARTEQVSTKDGYHGVAVVCSARYVPIAGHRPERAQTKFMVANRDMELWLTDLPNTRLLVPWRIVVGTQIGRLIIDTVRFAGPGSDATGSAPVK